MYMRPLLQAPLSCPGTDTMTVYIVFPIFFHVCQGAEEAEGGGRVTSYSSSSLRSSWVEVTGREQAKFSQRYAVAFPSFFSREERKGKWQYRNPVLSPSASISAWDTEGERGRRSEKQRHGESRGSFQSLPH